MAAPFQSMFCYFRWHLDHSGLFLECVHFGYDPSLSHRTSISASSSHLLLIVRLVLSLLPRSLHHTTELVWPQLCKLFPSVSMASSSHTTLHCISSSFSMLHSLCVISVAMSPVSSTLEPRYLKCYTLCSSSPNRLSSLAIAMSIIKSMNWVFGLLILIPLSSNALLQVSKYSVIYVSPSPQSTMSSANNIDPGTFFLTSPVNVHIHQE